VLELIALVCAIAVAIWTPQEVTKVIGGWVNKRFKGDQAAFLVAYRKQLNFMRIFGMIACVAMTAIAVIEFADAGDTLRGGLKIVAAIIWGVVALVAHRGRDRLDAAMAAGRIPAPAPAV